MFLSECSHLSSSGTSFCFFQLYVTVLNSFIKPKPKLLSSIFSLSLSSELCDQVAFEPHVLVINVLPLPILIVLPAVALKDVPNVNLLPAAPVSTSLLKPTDTLLLPVVN